MTRTWIKSKLFSLNDSSLIWLLNFRSLPLSIAIKVGSNVKREFEKYLAISCHNQLPVTRPRSRRPSSPRTQKMTELNSVKSYFSCEILHLKKYLEFVLKKQKDGSSLLRIPRCETEFIENFIVRYLQAEIVTEEEI